MKRTEEVGEGESDRGESSLITFPQRRSDPAMLTNSGI